MSVRSDKAARRFFNKLLPHERWDFTDHKAKSLIRAAFLLYEHEWRPNHNILLWNWPFATLERGECFDGDEPWAVLLQRAAEIAYTPTARVA